MGLIKTVANEYPLAMAAFVKWLTARNTLQPYAPFLRRPMEELPVEMVYGILALFFAEQGVIMGHDVTTRGRYRPTVYRRRVTGLYGKSHTGRLKSKPEEVMRCAIMVASRSVNIRLETAMRLGPPDEQTDVVIGLDVDQLLEEGRKRQLKDSCLK